MTHRERAAALVAAILIALLARTLLRAPPIANTSFISKTWLYPSEDPAGLWVHSRVTPANAVRLLCVARDAVTGERLEAQLGARGVEQSFSHVVGGTHVAFWDLPAGMETVLQASTRTHYSATGYRVVPDVPGSMLAMTVWLLPRPALLAGVVQRGERVRLLRPPSAGAEWEFVNRLRGSGLATAGLEEAWQQLFAAAVFVQPDGQWSHTCLPGLPLVVEVSPRPDSGRGPARATVTPVRDINRVSPADADGAGRQRAVPIVRPPYPSQWPGARVALRAVSEAGTPLDAVVRVRSGPGGDGSADEVARGTGSLEFAVAPKSELTIEVSAAGYAPRAVAVRFEPLDRWWIPEFTLERVR